MIDGKQGAAEWLRKKAQSVRRAKGFGCKELMASEFGESCDGRRCADCYADLFERIADRIDAERALPEGIEWPRFEDGELVKVGDTVGSDEPFTAKEIAFEPERWLIKASSRSAFGCFHGAFGDPVKRQTPKVLDADGAPIEVGDVVYYDGEPHPLTVVGITRDGKDALVDANGEESCVEGGRPQDFSHDAPKPVLDADGVPIKVGDTVYFVGGSGARYAVKDIGFEPGGAFVDIIDEGRYSATVNPEILTHEQPDSWERIEEDAYNLVMSEYLETPEDDVRDLVRRAKALAKAVGE